VFEQVVLFLLVTLFEHVYSFETKQNKKQNNLESCTKTAENILFHLGIFT